MLGIVMCVLSEAQPLAVVIDGHNEVHEPRGGFLVPALP